MTDQQKQQIERMINESWALRRDPVFDGRVSGIRDAMDVLGYTLVFHAQTQRYSFQQDEERTRA